MSPSVVVKDHSLPQTFKEKSPMKASPTVGPIVNKTPDLIPPPLKPPSQAYAYQVSQLSIHEKTEPISPMLSTQKGGHVSPTKDRTPVKTKQPI